MKGQKPIHTVSDLMKYLEACSPDAEVSLMPEEGEGFMIGGVLEFNSNSPKEVWILIDEFSYLENDDEEVDNDDDDSEAIAWSGEGRESDERPGDMAQQSYDLDGADAVVVRGKMRSA